MTLSALRRLTAMQPGELQFRLICELRKTGGRLQAALSTPRWDRRRLARTLARTGGHTAAWSDAWAAAQANDFRAAHRALAGHFTSRTSPFPLNARDTSRVVAAIARDFPGAAAHAVGRAEEIVAGRYDLLGYTDLELGAMPDWHADTIHGRQSPRVFWASVPYLSPAAGDHKVIWELNRHQHWLTLGRAFALTGDRRYYHQFTGQLASWLRDNPPLVGTNWASMLELAFRTLSWLWALELFAPAAGPDDAEPWLVDLLLAIDRQLTHVEHNLSHYFSPNTHLTGEALALYVAGLALPELRASPRRTAAGRDVLVQEARRQVRADGGHAELSGHYHRYSTDFYLLAAAVARRAGDPAAPALEDAARQQARYLRAIADDRGRRPQIGDDDGGQLFPMCGRSPDDCSDTLATAAVLLADPSLAIGPPPEESYWMSGAARPPDSEAARAAWHSIALPASGYFVSRTTRGDHLVFDAGPHGYLTGGHAHADALALTLAVRGRPVLVDGGTATYTMDRALRDRFRSTMMHNALVVDGRSQSEPRGPFHWKTTADAHAPIWRSSGDCDYVEGTHAGYAPRRHTRAVLAIHGLGWWIVDHVVGDGTASLDQYWRVHPSWTMTASGGRGVRLATADDQLALVSSAPLDILAEGDPLAVWSPSYGRIEPAPVAVARLASALPATVATFVPASPEMADGLEMEAVAIETPAPSGWHGAAFRVRWNAGAMLLLSSIERTVPTTRESASPGDRWGAAEVWTDARLAVLVDRRASASEVILVNGTMLGVHPGQRLVSLSQPIPLLRLASAGLAPGVHEVVTVD